MYAQDYFNSSLVLLPRDADLTAQINPIERSSLRGEKKEKREREGERETVLSVARETVTEGREEREERKRGRERDRALRRERNRR